MTGITVSSIWEAALIVGARRLESNEHRVPIRDSNIENILTSPLRSSATLHDETIVAGSEGTKG